MDNASKALIMAGAVLIAVALVGVGVYLYRAATSSIESGADTIDQASVQMGNQIVYSHGRNKDVISRRDARLLAEDIINGKKAGKLACTLKVGTTELTKINDVDSTIDAIAYELLIEVSESTGAITLVTLNAQSN